MSVLLTLLSMMMLISNLVVNGQVSKILTNKPYYNQDSDKRINTFRDDMYAYEYEPVLLQDNFEDLMQSGLPGDYLMMRHPSSQTLLQLYKDIYEMNFVSQKKAQARLKMPKMIHQIWLNEEEMPSINEIYTKNCQSIHQGWKYKLWTSKNLHEVRFDPNIFHRIPNIQEKKQYLMFAILSQYGGIYLDEDFVCLLPLDELIHKFKFFTSLEPAQPWSQIPPNSLTIMGASIRSPYVDKAIDYLNNYYSNPHIRRVINEFSYFDKAEYELEFYTNAKFSRLAISKMLMDMCSQDISTCSEIMVFPPPYFEAPFFSEFTFKELVRPYYSQLSLDFDFTRDIFGNERYRQNDDQFKVDALNFSKEEPAAEINYGFNLLFSLLYREEGEYKFGGVLEHTIGFRDTNKRNPLVYYDDFQI